MKYLVTATDTEGRSYIADEVERTGEVTEMKTFEIYRGPSIPAPPPMQALGTLMPVAPEPGQTTWKVVEFPPAWGYETHCSLSYDFSTVIEGYVDFSVDSGSRTLGPGDCVLVAGTSHKWHTQEGCRLLVVMLGARR